MACWILTVAALDAADAAQTLRFTDGDYIDAGANYYEKRLIQPAAITVAPNDGGNFTFFRSDSVGEIELANLDRGLNYLADYAIDGRTATLSLVDGATVTTVFSGAIDRMSERNGSVLLSFKALTEQLNSDHPMSTYAGTNSAPNGLEGLPETIKGDVKPKAFGDCRNVTPKLPNSTLLIYEASNRSDAVITAVYDDGVRLTNYLVNGAKSAGATSINVDTGTGGIPDGSKVMFDSHRTIYTVLTGLSGGVIVLTTGLTAAIADNSCVEIVNSYTGSGTAAGELQNAAPSGAWASYNGYFRLSATPSKAITCDVMSVSSGVLHKAGDVFSAIAAERGITVDSASITELNAAGYVGIYVADNTPTKTLFDAIARSVGGFYHYIGSTLYLNLLQAPTGTALFTLEEWHIVSAEREGTGIGSNGLPIYEVAMKYDRLSTTQATVAGGVSKDRADFLKKGYRDTKETDAPTLTRHPLAERLSIDSVLRNEADATAVCTRLLTIGKVRRDIVTVTARYSEIPAFNIGDEVWVKYAKLGYAAGRSMIILGFERDIKKKKLFLRCFG